MNYNQQILQIQAVLLQSLALYSCLDCSPSAEGWGRRLGPPLIERQR